jgi:hypothetical protein
VRIVYAELRLIRSIAGRGRVFNLFGGSVVDWKAGFAEWLVEHPRRFFGDENSRKRRSHMCNP